MKTLHADIEDYRGKRPNGASCYMVLTDGDDIFAVLDGENNLLGIEEEEASLSWAVEYCPGSTSATYPGISQKGFFCLTEAGKAAGLYICNPASPTTSVDVVGMALFFGILDGEKWLRQLVDEMRKSNTALILAARNAGLEIPAFNA